MSELFKQFSSVENLKKAYDLVNSHIKYSNLGLLPVNNAGRTAINELGDLYFEQLSNNLLSEEYQPESVFTTYQLKDSLDLRPVLALSTTDRIVFQALLNPEILGRQIDDRLEDVCCANRVSSGDIAFFRQYTSQWNLYYWKQVEAFRKGYAWRLHFDITGFFENIRHETLLNDLSTVCEDEKIRALLGKQLEVWGNGGSKSGYGIPQGPQASWVLANYYLDYFDKESLLLAEELDTEYFRYADDMVVMAKNRKQLLEYSEKAALLLRSKGLTINEKSNIKKLEDDKTLLDMQFSPSGFDGQSDGACIPYKTAKGVVDAILTESRVERSEISDLRHFYQVYEGKTDLRFCLDTLKCLEYKPSLIDKVSIYLATVIQRAQTISTSLSEELIEGVLDSWKKCALSNQRKWLYKILIEVLDQDSKHYREVDKETKKLVHKHWELEEVLLYCLFKFKNGQSIGYRELLTYLDRFEDPYCRGILLFFGAQLRSDSLKKLITNQDNSIADSPEARLIIDYLKTKYDLGNLPLKVPRTNAASLKQINVDTQESDKQEVVKVIGRELKIVSDLGLEKRVKSAEQECIEIETTAGRMILNKSNGKVCLGSYCSEISPNNAEFKLLWQLVRNTNRIVTYEELGYVSKQQKRAMSFALRDAKKCIGILPKKEAVNDDVIDNKPKIGYIIKSK